MPEPTMPRRSSRRRAEPSISATLLGPGLALLEAAGVDVDAFLAKFELDRRALADRSQRLPRRQVYALVDAAVAATKNRDLGLHGAELAARTEGLLGAVEYVGRASATIGEMMRSHIRFGRILQEDIEF